MNQAGVPGVWFESSGETLKALQYEQRVSAGGVPTRNVAHDWYNGLVWLRYPKTKRLINHLHVQEGVRDIGASANGRSPLRDALTLFDESGALLLTTDAKLVGALMAHDWHALFVDRDNDWRTVANLMVVGHGLLESMQKAHKGLCAKVIPVLVSNLEMPACERERLLIAVIHALRAPANFCPLPVMGVPGWFPDSETPGFYEDKAVFRAKPTRNVDYMLQRLAFRWDGTTLQS